MQDTGSPGPPNNTGKSVVTFLFSCSITLLFKHNFIYCFMFSLILICYKINLINFFESYSNILQHFLLEILERSRRCSQLLHSWPSKEVTKLDFSGMEITA